MRDLSSIIHTNNARAATEALSTSMITFRRVGPAAFVAARDRSTRPQFLTPAPPWKLHWHQLYVSQDDMVGYAISPAGDLQGVFNNGGPRGAGRLAIRDAVRNGAQTLDAFDGYLVRLYTECGFVETSRVRFDDAYAPAGWNYETDGRPDVVFMALAG